MKSVNNKKSVIFCAFSLNVNNIFCVNGLCGIWSGNKIIEAEKGDKDKFIDNIINNKDLKIKDSDESLIIDNGNSFKEELLDCFKDYKENKEGILTEFEYNKKFHYFFSTKSLIVTDFLEKPTSDEVKVFGELSSRNFKKINVEVKGGKLIIKEDKPFDRKPIQNPDINSKDQQKSKNNQGNSLPGTDSDKYNIPNTDSNKGKEHNTRDDSSKEKPYFSNNKSSEIPSEEDDKIPSKETEEKNKKFSSEENEKENKEEEKNKEMKYESKKANPKKKKKEMNNGTEKETEKAKNKNKNKTEKK